MTTKDLEIEAMFLFNDGVTDSIQLYERLKDRFTHEQCTTIMHFVNLLKHGQA